MECGTPFVRRGAQPWTHWRGFTSHVEPNLSWKAQASSPQRETSFRTLDTHGWWIEYTVSQRWRTHPSSLQLPEMMISGGDHMIWKRFTYGHGSTREQIIPPEPVRTCKLMHMTGSKKYSPTFFTIDSKNQESVQKNPIAPFLPLIPETRNLRRFLVSGINGKKGAMGFFSHHKSS